MPENLRPQHAAYDLEDVESQLQLPVRNCCGYHSGVMDETNGISIQTQSLIALVCIWSGEYDGLRVPYLP